MMKDFVESVKYMCSDEDGNFQPTIAVVGSIAATLFVPLLWVFLYAIGCN